MVIVFDVDGTLFDTKREVLTALNIVLDQYGIERITPEEEDRFVGPPFNVTLTKYRNCEPIRIPTIVETFRNEYKKIICESVMFDGMLEVLNELSEKGHILGIATMKPNEQLDILLAQNNIVNLFAVLKSVDGIFSEKTSMLEDIKRNFLNENDFFMVGDTDVDYKAACESGYQFVAADYGYGDIKDLDVIHISKPTDLLFRIL